MPGGRRNIASRSGTTKLAADDRGFTPAVGCENQINSNQPKHVTIPHIPVDSEFTFEFLAFVTAAIAMASQYLNLYRTVWWLPHSHMEYAMNLYLIDGYVAVFCLIMVGRRLPLSFFKKIAFFILPGSVHPTGVQVSRFLSIFAVVPALSWCVYQVFLRHGLLSLFCLGYPALVYFILFGPSLLPVLEMPSWRIENISSPSASKAKWLKSDIATVGHVCSWSAEPVREEVENLKSDFNSRLKHILFNSLLVAYYAAFVPCCHAQSSLHYDTVWVSQHIGFVFLSNFSMYIIYCFPPRYCDTLHRAALHLGRWQKVESRNVHIPYSLWSESTLWQQGALVKHVKEIYRAEGMTNAAEPGNNTHARFYGVFSNPMGAISSLLGLQVTLIIALVVVLIRSSEWNHVIAVGLLLMLNFPTLFKVARAYLVLGKVYHAEQVFQHKFSS